MFFVKENFTDILPENKANLVAQIANKIIAEHGSLTWGSLFEGGEVCEFSSLKGDKDTHVGILIGIKPMGIFQPQESPIEVSGVPEGDLVQAQKDRNAALHRENAALREERT